MWCTAKQKIKSTEQRRAKTHSKWNSNTIYKITFQQINGKMNWIWTINPSCKMICKMIRDEITAVKLSCQWLRARYYRVYNWMGQFYPFQGLLVEPMCALEVFKDATPVFYLITIGSAQAPWIKAKVIMWYWNTRILICKKIWERVCALVRGGCSA